MVRSGTVNMTEGNPLVLILKFTLPLLMGNLFQQAYNVADAVIVGRILGAKALAGVGASSSVQFLILGFCIGLCGGFSIPVAQSFGAKDRSSLRKYIFHSFLIVGILSCTEPDTRRLLSVLGILLNGAVVAFCFAAMYIGVVM